MQLSACRLAGLTALAVLLPGAAPPREGSLEDALQSIKPDAILQHIKVLASDEYEGRGPGTPGEDKTIAYLTGQFRAMGLKPGNPDGSYVQNVPLVGFQATRVGGSFRAGGKTIELEFPKNFVAMPGRAGEQPKIDDSEVVFVGHGVVAPEYGWDDFKGLDVRGKPLIMLVGDPPVPDPSDLSKLDPAMFKGRAMTYYGRWTYKYEIAAKLGASAAILVHEDGPAGYPFSVVQGSWSRENFDIVTSGSVAPAPAVPVKGWIDSPTAKALCLAAGQDLAALKLAAVRRDFRPVVLNARARFDIEVKARQVQSHNVIARLEGSDQALKNQYVVYTAHWDHLGIDPNLKGDQIYNGAADNATGCALLLELARAWGAQSPKPKRSAIFLAVTAEEKGLLGSKYYARNPLIPLNKTALNLNFDMILPLGVPESIVVT
ncbi:MAG: M28 family peptidase, partial [Isosphaeraceae bacterium]